MNTIPDLSITIPAFNEEETIEAVFINAEKSAKHNSSNYEIVLIDDGSTDRTGAILDAIKKRSKKVVVIHHKKNLGFSGAMRSCYEHASGELIFLGPGDGQFDYSEIRKFIHEIKNHDIVVSYRIFNEEKNYRKINSFIFHALSRILFGIQLKEFSSCMLYHKYVRDSIKIKEANPFSCLFLLEFIYKAMTKGFSFGQVPIHFYKRKGGVQKGSNPKMIIRTLLEMFRFWYKIRIGKVSA